LIAVVLGAPSSAARALKAAQLLERGFSSTTGLNWLMPALGTVDAMEPVSAAPPNLRDDMCGAHRKRPATEDEEEIAPTNFGPDSPYGVFISSLRAPKPKGNLLQDATMGEPVLVYTGTKPPAPGAAAAAEAKKPAKKKAAAAKSATSKEGSISDDEPAAKPKPKKPAAKPTVLTPTSAPVDSQQTSQMR
jgi:D-alanyl-D-alanine carboxypeptidase